MNGWSGRWRRLAASFLQHAALVLPGEHSPWLEAMRRELDYIETGSGALSWALGCVLTSYKARLTHWSRFSVRTAWRWVGTAGALIVLIIASLQGPASGQTEPIRPAFHEMTCDDLPNVSPEVRPRLRCGTVSVPRDYAKPNAGQFKLAVVIVKSAQSPSLPDPVVYINGGPGEPLTIYADHQARTPYAPDRDLILVDQRGTGRSEPNLCPSRNGTLLDADMALLADDTEDVMAKRRAAYLACRDEAITGGFDLGNFGTRVTVEDFEWVRRALGIERWNVYGESYGTTVAMTLAALHPEPVRSVVLDSVYPPDPMPPHSAIAADALAAFFASCARDQACSTAFPDLAGTYRETLARLDQAPLLVALPPQMHWADDHGLLRASSFEAIVNNLVYYPSAYPNLPRLIESVHEGDTRGIAAVLPSLLAAAATSNRATRAAVECRDRPRYRDVLPATASLLDRMQPHDICDGWSELGAPPLVPVDTKVPTLVLAGQFDPVSGPNFSHHVANQISANAQWIEFPLVGHNVRAFSSCGAKIAADFIEQPTQALDTTCVDRRPPIRFLAK